MNKKTELDIAEPKLSRTRKLPNFYHVPSSNGSFYHDQTKKLYRQFYFDDILNWIKDQITNRQITRYMCISKKS